RSDNPEIDGAREPGIERSIECPGRASKAESVISLADYNRRLDVGHAAVHQRNVDVETRRRGAVSHVGNFWRCLDGRCCESEWWRGNGRIRRRARGHNRPARCLMPTTLTWSPQSRSPTCHKIQAPETFEVSRF